MLQKLPEIEVTAEELLEFKRLKAEKLERQRRLEEYSRLINRRFDYPTYTPEQYLSKIIERGHKLAEADRWDYGFEIFEPMQPYYEMLCHYFLGLESVRDFNSLTLRPISLNKGIMLRGGFGIGKTVMMRLFAWNPRQCFTVVPCQQIVAAHDASKTREVSEQKILDFSMYQQLPIYVQQSIHLNNGYWGHTMLGMCYDDLGSEHMGSVFGQVNVMQRILSRIYDKSRSNGQLVVREFSDTHIVTNASNDDISRMYDARIVDRLNEMFNIVELPKMESLR